MPRVTPSDARAEVGKRRFAGTGASHDLMVHLATFGIDRLWKRRLVAKIPPDARRIVDLACGTGLSTYSIARRFPGATVVGVEPRAEYLAQARAKRAFRRFPNVEFVLSRAEDYRCAVGFDCVVSSYLAKYADVDRLLDALDTLLVPGGRLLLHDFTYPPRADLQRLFHAYFWVLQRGAGPLFPHWREMYEALPAVIAETCWHTALPAALARRGYRGIRLEYLTAYGSAIVSAHRPPARLH